VASRARQPAEFAKITALTPLALDLFSRYPSAIPAQAAPVTAARAIPAPAGHTFGTNASGPERVLASELEGRTAASDALSMMVSSMVRMVQAGKSSDSRWEAS
jgi:hypothetical protein